MTDFDMPSTGTWEERGGWVVRALVRDIGLTIDQAAGLVGNLGYESVGFTKLQEISPSVPGSAGGYGWAQWTGRRRRRYEAWCTARNLAMASDEANYGFILDDLRGSYKTFTANLMLTLDIEEACRLTHKEYETPSDVLDGSYRSFPDRLHWAKRALAGAQSMPPGTHDPAPAPGPVQPPEPPVARTDDPVSFGAGIETIQLGLRQAGFYNGSIDGIWGKGSADALDAFRVRMRP